MRRQFFPVLITFLAELLLIVGSASASGRAVRLTRADYLAPLPPPLPLGANLRFERLSDEQGLSMSVVNSIAQDQQGYMWFATQDGLNRYDGYQFQVYKHDPDNPDSLANSWIETLYVDSTDTLWAGTLSGLDRFDPIAGKFAHFHHNPDDPTSLSHDVVKTIYEDRSGVLWVATMEGLDCLDRQSGQFKHIYDEPNTPQALRDSQVAGIIQDHTGILWLATNGGLFAYDPVAGQFTHYQHDPADPRSLSLDVTADVLEDHDGNIWVATRGEGLDRMGPDRQGFDHFAPNEKVTGSLVYGDLDTLLEDSRGYLWVGSWGAGLFRFDPATQRFAYYYNDVSNPHSLSGDVIASLYEDASGVIWVGTWGASLNKFDLLSEQFVNYRQNSKDLGSLASSMVWAALDDGDSIWIGTDEGLDRLDRQTGKVQHFQNDKNDPSSLYNNSVLSLHKDRQGEMWVGMVDGGLGRYNAATGGFDNYVLKRRKPGQTHNTAIYFIAEDEQGYQWLGTSCGLIRFDPGSGEFEDPFGDLSSPSSLNSKKVLVLYIDPNGVLWLGTEEGLDRYDPQTGEVKNYKINTEDPTGLSSSNILTILQDAEGIFWLGTLGGGLYRFDPTSGLLRSYREKDGLPNDTLYGLLQDEAGYLWMSTNKGLARFDPRAGDVKCYYARDGLQGNEFNQGAYHRGADGELFFGGVGGLTVFQPQNIGSNSYVPPIALVSLTQNGQPIRSEAVQTGDGTGDEQPIAAVKLEYPQNSFEFEFAALNFVQPEKNQYAYRLEGFDAQWIYTNGAHVGRYTNLPGGKYTLRMKASNNDGVWNEQGIALQVTVVPPFWQTGWFLGGMILFAGLAVFAGYRLRVHNVVAHNRRLEQQVGERTREIERRRQELEALYRADEDLHKNLRLDAVLQSLVDSAIRLLNADKGTLLVWDNRQSKLVPRIARGFSPETLKNLSLSPGEGVAGNVAISGKPTCIEDTWTEPSVSRQITDAEGIRAFMQVPIWVGGEVFGVFSADFTRPRRFSEDELRLLNSLAQRAAQAIQNAQLYEQIEEQAVAEERSRLARELHDAVTQTLFSASLIAEALPAAWENNPDEGRDLLGELRQLSRGALAEMRTLLMELRPSALEESNLGDLLRQLGEAAAGHEGIPITVVTNGYIDLPADVHIAFYRIVQEALNNVVKHARASQVNIHLRNIQHASGSNGDGRSGIVMTVRDDGRGFDPEQVTSDHLGLDIMRERAESIGATLTIESMPGQGTQITVLWEGNHEPSQSQPSEVSAV